MFNLTVDEVKELSKKYNMIPLTIECYADMDTPISVFKRMQTEKDCFLLESIGQNHVTARFSFIGRNPFISFKSLNDEITISDYKSPHQIIDKMHYEIQITLYQTHQTAVHLFL